MPPEVSNIKRILGSSNNFVAPESHVRDKHSIRSVAFSKTTVSECPRSITPPRGTELGSLGISLENLFIERSDSSRQLDNYVPERLLEIVLAMPRK